MAEAREGNHTIHSRFSPVDTQAGRIMWREHGGRGGGVASTRTSRERGMRGGTFSGERPRCPPLPPTPMSLFAPVALTLMVLLTVGVTIRRNLSTTCGSDATNCARGARSVALDVRQMCRRQLEPGKENGLTYGGGLRLGLDASAAAAAPPSEAVDDDDLYRGILRHCSNSVFSVVNHLRSSRIRETICAPLVDDARNWAAVSPAPSTTVSARASASSPARAGSRIAARAGAGADSPTAAAAGAGAATEGADTAAGGAAGAAATGATAAGVGPAGTLCSLSDDSARLVRLDRLDGAPVSCLRDMRAAAVSLRQRVDLVNRQLQ